MSKKQYLRALFGVCEMRAQDNKIYGAGLLLSQVNECCLIYNIELPEKKCPEIGSNGIEKIKIPFDITDLPDFYPKKSTHDFLILLIDWKNKFAESNSHVFV